MQVFRTVLWVALSLFIASFVAINWGEPQWIKFWIGENPIGFEWPVGFIALFFWLLGVIPTWLYHRGVKWSLNRRIRSLEASIKSNALAQRHEPDRSTQAPAPAVDKPVENTVQAGDTLTPAEGTPPNE